MNEQYTPVIMDFPLRGEWFSPNTPGARIPSHGTNRFGTRYAYDFLQVDWKRRGHPSYQTHWLKYLLFGVPLQKCYCWGENVYAPCDGTVVDAKDDHRERSRAHLISDLYVAVKSAHFYNPRKDHIQSIAGNYIIIKYNEHVYAAFAHLQCGSIKVIAGQKVKRGEVLGKIGHSGNSFFPHLHFQLMDNRDMNSAQGVPCAFKQYKVFGNGQWETVKNGIPTDTDRIRFPHKTLEI